MAVRALMDNDVIVKGAAYGVLAEIVVALGGNGAVAILGSARFVVRDRIARDPRIRDRDRTRTNWGRFAASAIELEPSDETISLATSLEEAATDLGLQLDSGESILCAEAIAQPASALLTGDKRAIEALERLLPVIGELRDVSNRVVCLEQVIDAIVRRIGEDTVRAAVCDEPRVDIAVALCFQCHRDADGRLDPEGLRSYIADARRRAPTMLAREAPF